MCACIDTHSRVSFSLNNLDEPRRHYVQLNKLDPGRQDYMISLIKKTVQLIVGVEWWLLGL